MAEVKEKKEEKNLNESIIGIRVSLQNANLKQSGFNKLSSFYYFELGDFLPKLNELMNLEKINDIFTIENGVAKLTLIKKDESQSYTIPFREYEVPISNRGNRIMQEIQYLGAVNSYLKRYLYMNAFGISDGEIVDSLNIEEKAPTTRKPASQTATQPATKTQPSKPEEQENSALKEALLKTIKSIYTVEELQKLFKTTDINLDPYLEKITEAQAKALIQRKSSGA